MTTETILIWLDPAPAAAGVLSDRAVHRTRTRRSAIRIAVGAAALSWLGSMVVFVRALGMEHLGEHPFASAINWLPTGDTWFADRRADRPARARWCCSSWPGRCLMIFLYSVGYHNFGQPAGDHDQRRPAAARRDRDR
ncbi:MAG: hypothetical protein M0C28_28435 [Candidatus Moduliflexus flocculans]|nr:hypothetical protein [Candidatus Moduliflexus flocculans]